jgi:hypothetical protein
LRFESVRFCFEIVLYDTEIVAFDFKIVLCDVEIAHYDPENTVNNSIYIVSHSKQFTHEKQRPQVDAPSVVQ